MKKLLAIVISMAMVLAMLPMGVYAEGNTKNVSTAAELKEALENANVTNIVLNNDIDMQDSNWTSASIGKGRTLLIDGKNHSISNMIISNYLNPGSGSGVAGDGSSATYYAGFIGNNQGNLTIKNLGFTNAAVDMEPLSENSTGSSILAVVLGMNSGTAILENVNVNSSTVKGYTKVGILHGFTSTGSFEAKKCSIENSKIVMEADGTDPEASLGGIIIGYDGYSLAKTKGIRLENNSIEIADSVGWETRKTEEDGTVLGYVKSLEKWLGIASPTYTHGSYATDSVKFVAEVDGYKYETLTDAIASIPTDGNEVEVTLLDDVAEQGIAIDNKKI